MRRNNPPTPELLAYRSISVLPGRPRGPETVSVNSNGRSASGLTYCDPHPGAAQVTGHPQNVLRQLSSARCRRCSSGGTSRAADALEGAAEAKQLPDRVAIRARDDRSGRDSVHTQFLTSLNRRAGCGSGRWWGR